MQHATYLVSCVFNACIHAALLERHLNSSRDIWRPFVSCSGISWHHARWRKLCMQVACYLYYASPAHQPVRDIFVRRPGIHENTYVHNHMKELQTFGHWPEYNSRKTLRMQCQSLLSFESFC